MSFDRGWLVGRNLPELGEAAKMVKTDKVTGLRGPAQALDPPAIAAAADRIPVVERITPPLSVGAKVIGRDPRDDVWCEVITQAEQIAVRPNVGTVVIHKNGNIAHHANGFVRAVMAKRMPLLPEEKLQDAAYGKIRSEFLLGRFDRSRFAAGQRRRPVLPIIAVPLAESIE